MYYFNPELVDRLDSLKAVNMFKTGIDDFSLSGISVAFGGPDRMTTHHLGCIFSFRVPFVSEK